MGLSGLDLLDVGAGALGCLGGVPGVFLVVASAGCSSLRLVTWSLNMGP